MSWSERDTRAYKGISTSNPLLVSVEALWRYWNTYLHRDEALEDVKEIYRAMHRIAIQEPHLRVIPRPIEVAN